MNYLPDKPRVLGLACAFLALSLLPATSAAEEDGKEAASETGKALNTLNTDMDKFSEEFLGGKNAFEPVKRANNRITDKFKSAAEKKESKKDPGDQPAEIPNDLKFSEKESEEEISSEIDVPDLNKKTADVKIENDSIKLSYEKNPKMDLKSGAFGKKTKSRFSKTFAAPKKADLRKYRTSIKGNKIIVTFKKKKK